MNDMNDHQDHIEERTLMLYYLDQLDATSKEEVREWLKEPENKAVYGRWVRIWQTADAVEDFEKIDVEANWKRFQRSIGQSQSNFGFWKIAAAVLLFAAVTFLVQKVRTYESVTQITFTAEANDQYLMLPDSSEVWLKAGTTLEYPSVFDSDQRQVELKGEALFEVRHQPERPFRVMADETTTEVLGTSFNLRTEKYQIPLELVLLNGKVKFSTANEVVLLQPGQKVALSADGSLVKKANDNLNYLAWKTGAFTFERTPMEEVMKDLSSAFGFQYQFESSTFSSCTLTAKYEQQSLDEILNSLAVLFDAAFSRANDRLTISGGQCNR